MASWLSPTADTSPRAGGSFPIRDRTEAWPSYRLDARDMPSDAVSPRPSGPADEHTLHLVDGVRFRDVQLPAR
ncbi:MAG: hypothetical protein R2734_09270 [Nocardioides sp.]